MIFADNGHSFKSTPRPWSLKNSSNFMPSSSPPGTANDSSRLSVPSTTGSKKIRTHSVNRSIGFLR